MISAPLQYDVPTITLAQLQARLDAEAAEHRARVAQIAALAGECRKSAQIHERSCRPCRPRAKRPKRTIICIETGRKFPSVRSAALWAGVWPTTIYCALRAKRHYRKTRFHWKAG